MASRSETQVRFYENIIKPGGILGLKFDMTKNID